MRRLLGIVLAIVVAGCSSGGGSAPAGGEVWFGTGLAAGTGNNVPQFASRGTSFSLQSQGIDFLAHLSTKPTGILGLGVRIDGRDTTNSCSMNSTSDNEWWGFGTISFNYAFFGLVNPQAGTHTVIIMQGGTELATGSFTLTQ